MPAPATSVRPALFRVATAGALFAALYHAAALTVPAFASLTYPRAYPWWRHVIFIAIDGSLAWLLRRPPDWLVWPLSALTAQVLYSHGLGGWHAWQQTDHVNWIDPASIIGILCVLGIVLADRRERRAAESVCLQAAGTCRD
jgi:hypothetical protein